MWRHDQKLSSLNTNSRKKEKNTRSEKSLDSEKSLPLTNSLLYSDQLISRYHWKLKITSNHYITKITAIENELSLFHWWTKNHVLTHL